MSERDGGQEQLITAYVLGELEGEDLARFERRLDEDIGLRADVEALRPIVARLDALPTAAWEPPTPPPLRHPAEEAEPDSAPAAFRPARPRWSPFRLALAGGAAALALLGIGIGVGGLVFGDDERDQGGTVAGRSVELVPLPDGGDGHGELTVDGDDPAEAVLEVSGLPPNSEDFYEAWLLGKRGLVSLGSFRVGDSGSASVPLRLPVDPARYDDFDVSLEPDDGDPSHSGDSVLRSEGTGSV